VQPTKSPSIVHHKARNADVVFLRGADGKRRMVYLGVHGSEEARKRYHEVLAAHLDGAEPPSRSARSSSPAPSTFPNIEQLCGEFTAWALKEFLDASTGEVSREVVNFDHAIDHLLERHRGVHTDQFSIRDLLAVRQAMVDGGRLCRNVINARVRRIKAVFRWGTEQGFVPGEVFHQLTALRGLREGRGGARETKPVEPVTWKQVEALEPHLPPCVYGAVELQWWSGMRPDEVLQLTRRQLDMTGKVWLFRPQRHKGRWRGRERVVSLGPKAQKVLRPMLKLEPDAPLINPAAAWAWFKGEKRRLRKTPKTKQTRDRDARGAMPVRNEQLDTHTYRRMIARACAKAGVTPWGPHRLRHACGTRIAQQEGIEAARVQLGHVDDRVTRRYAHSADAAAAAAVAGRLG
jgi:integrase